MPNATITNSESFYKRTLKVLKLESFILNNFGCTSVPRVHHWLQNNLKIQFGRAGQGEL